MHAAAAAARVRRRLQGCSGRRDGLAARMGDVPTSLRCVPVLLWAMATVSASCRVCAARALAGRVTGVPHVPCAVTAVLRTCCCLDGDAMGASRGVLWADVLLAVAHEEAMRSAAAAGVAARGL